jgi:deoxyribose-phosphate aldolase
MDRKEFAKYVDHTLLKADSTHKDIDKLCKEAIEYGFHTVCIHPVYIEYAKELLKNSNVKLCTVTGFPFGTNLTVIKAREAYESVSRGADEIDMVLNIGELKNNNKKLVLDDIKYVVKESCGKTVKVILETCYLSEDELTTACLLSKEAGAHFVKTSTGFGPYGARVEDIVHMHSIVGDVMKIKAAGGIKTLETALAMINAGACRLGMSSSVDIISEIK